MSDDRPKGTRPKGFAALPKEHVIACARKGGIAAHAQGVGHEFSTEEARAAGKLGGRAAQAAKRAREERK
jgi:uncharacterized protein